MQDLKDLTHDIHYENYRTELIKSQNKDSLQYIGSPVLKNKLNNDETDKLLQQKDDELRKLQDLISKMKQNMPTANESRLDQASLGEDESSRSEESPTITHQVKQQGLRTFGKNSFTIANANCAIINRALGKSNDFTLPAKNTINFNFKQKANFQNLNYQTSSTAI